VLRRGGIRDCKPPVILGESRPGPIVAGCSAEHGRQQVPDDGRLLVAGDGCPVGEILTGTRRHGPLRDFDPFPLPPGGLPRRTASVATVRDLSGSPFYRLGAAFTEFHVHRCRRSRPEGGPGRHLWFVRDTGYMPGGAGAHPGTPGSTGCSRPDSKQTPHLKSDSSTISIRT
jgi:hypothetical protein